MNKISNQLCLGGSTIAILAAMSAGTALAQSTDSAQIEQVVVSASRISIAGYSQPTPVTVVSNAQIESEAKSDIGDVIRELPALSGGGNGGPQTGSGSITISGAPAGQSTLALRGLGLLRTLVLFDGQRVVQSNITGGTDLNTIPTSLVQRVDIVTGGASAAWGSDAVAGVVNLVLNKNFTGLKANLEGSDNYNSTYRTYKGEVSWGTGFDGDRGHIILSGAYTAAPDTVYVGQADWFKAPAILLNPAYAAGNGQPQYIHATNVGMSQATPGGVITASPAGVGLAANALRGIAFTGPSGTPTPFNFGNVVGAAAYGGDANFYNSQTPITAIADPYHSTTLFAYGSYKISDTIRASVQLNYGHEFAQNSGQAAFKLGNLTINSDNAYLDPGIAARMAAAGIPSFTLGTTDTNNANLHNLSANAAEQSLGIPVNNNIRQMMRGVFTLDGSLGDNWSWNAYYQHGESRVALRVINNTLVNNVTLASDAVRVTAANVGTSGLPIGSIACRSTLAAPTNGCQPLDVFGTGVASPAAIAYTNSYGAPDYENITLNQDVASGSMQGTLPWQLPAGPVAVAFGAEYRKEGGRTVADPRGATASWGSGNFASFAGQYNIEEGFLEADAPILKNDVVQSLDLNAAGRMTNYSTSGLVETWKLGLTSQVDDDFRLRGTWSVDIRAPNLSELFATHQINTGSQIDPRTGLPQQVATDKGGNPNLVPEVANTITGGVVLTPHWIEGLSMSLDWYAIDIHGAITTTGATQVIQQCQAGNQVYCSQLVFAGINGALSTVRTVPVNASSERTSGLDIEADYPMDLFAGTLRWHWVGNYNDEHTTVNLGVVCDSAGMLGSSSSTAQCAGSPKFTSLVSATYDQGPVSGTIQGRLSSSERLNNAWVSGVDVDNNSVPWNAYMDLRGSYKWTDNIMLYAAIDNVLDTPPTGVPPIYTGAFYEQLGATGDLLGRVARLGVRLNY